jgi:hypothetical protein
VVCFVLAASGCALIVFPNSTQPTEVRSEGQRQQNPSPGQPGAEEDRSAGEKSGDGTKARSEPPVTPDPSLVLDCKDFTSQGAAHKTLNQELEDQDTLDPDADGTACEALSVPDPEPKPDPEKSSKKEPESGKGSESKKKLEPRIEPSSKKKPTPEKEAEPEKKR